jgi:hypothetical protein
MCLESLSCVDCAVSYLNPYVRSLQFEQLVVNSSGSDHGNSLSDSFDDPRYADPLKDALTALVRSQQAMMERMHQDSRRKQKVFVAMPEQFNGKVGDF